MALFDRTGVSFMLQESNTYIVANRMPVKISYSENGQINLKRSAGGLVSALTPVHSHAKCWWVGSLDDPQILAEEYLKTFEDLKLIPVPVPKDVYARYYNGLSNGAIWPLFHYFPNHAEFNTTEWEAYQKVNELFCEQLAPRLKENDIVWVQDFQLMLLPKLLREAVPKVRIGYFHHIPFPASEVFRVFPWRTEVLHGLLGADVIGFHTLEYTRHFISSVARLLGFDNFGEDIFVNERIVKVGAFPLGIDTEALIKASQSERSRSKFDEISATFAQKKLILGIDRLDYTKGISERLKAFRLFLERNPDWRDKVVLLLVCVPSRTEVSTYHELRLEVERLVGKINGEYGGMSHTPVQYLFQSVDMDQLTALYRRADVCLVTPLRDGLNLVCKEYAAVRDDLDGVLVLSEFAGASEEMGEALLVNPYEASTLAQGIEMALTMPPEERHDRMEILRNRVLEFDNRRWAQSFIEILNDSVERNLLNESREFENAEFEKLCARMQKSERTLICFDYDGLFYLRPRRFENSPQLMRFRALIEQLSRLEGVSVAACTAQTREFCDSFFADLPVSIAAENGAFLRSPQANDWNVEVGGDSLESYRHDILAILERCVRRVPRSRIEMRETSIVWHFKQARSAFALNLAYEMAHTLNLMMSKGAFHCFIGNGFLEVRSTLVNKGSALESICQKLGLSGEELLVTIADSRTDEEMFRVRQDQNISVHIGSPSVFSHLTVRDHKEWHRILDMLVSKLRSKNSAST